MSGHSFSKEAFPNTQSKSPLTQLEAIASHPIASYLGDQHLPHYNLLSGSCAEQEGPSSASFSPG